MLLKMPWYAITACLDAFTYVMVYLFEFMQVGEFLYSEEEQQQVVQFNILLHAIPKLYWSKGSGGGEVFFFTDNESAPRGGNIAFCVPHDTAEDLFELLVRNLQSHVNLFLKL